MRIFLFILTLVATAALFVFCKHQPSFTADNLPPKQLRWGSGGGVVGKESSRILLQNGQLFQREITGSTMAAGQKKAKKALAIFKTAEALGLSKLEFNHPGNTYSFLEWQDGDMVSRVVWGDPKFPVDANIKALYEQLNGLVKK